MDVITVVAIPPALGTRLLIAKSPIRMHRAVQLLSQKELMCDKYADALRLLSVFIDYEQTHTTKTELL